MSDEARRTGWEAVDREESQAQKRSRGGAEASSQESVLSEEAQARAIAQRLGIEYVDLHEFTMVPELFRNIPVELMFRYNFVPLRREGSGLVIIVAQTSDARMI